MSAYQKLEAHFQKIDDLQHVAAMVGWDESAMMPAGGGAARGRAMATLGVVIHSLVIEPEVGDWIASAQSEPLDDWQAANLREINTSWRKETCMPSDLVASLRITASRCEQAWRSYRADNNWTALQPLLEEVVHLAREEATVRSESTNLSLYDAMLDMYEPGVRSQQVDAVFADLKSFLPGLVEQVIEKQSPEDVLELPPEFSVEKQKALGQKMMEQLGFDFNHGRLDISHHPFCGGVPEDVRITTRYDTTDFSSSLMAVIHETGHALYEQGLPVKWRSQPVGKALSAGTHESQSLLMEMQASRSLEFFHFAAPIIQRIFLGQESNDPAWNAHNLHRLSSRVKKGFIRVDADEVTYPLHVIMRYEIEKMLIEGDLEVASIPDAWDEKMQAYLSLSTKDNFADGCMQDVHWPAGLFGYFPTYTLGAMTAAQLYGAALDSINNLQGHLSQGNFQPLLAWLRENVHSQGKFKSYDNLMIDATGRKLDAGFFKQHLSDRYL